MWSNSGRCLHRCYILVIFAHFRKGKWLSESGSYWSSDAHILTQTISTTALRVLGLATRARYRARAQNRGFSVFREFLSHFEWKLQIRDGPNLGELGHQVTVSGTPDDFQTRKRTGGTSPGWNMSVVRQLWSTLQKWFLSPKMGENVTKPWDFVYTFLSWIIWKIFGKHTEIYEIHWLDKICVNRSTGCHQSG